MKMWQSFGINLLLMLAWGLIQESTTLLGYGIGFIVAFLVTWFINPGYGTRSLRAVGFIFFILWQIILSAMRVTYVVLGRRELVQPGIVAIPLQLRSSIEVLILASSIALTPGTVAVETGTDDQGDIVLFVHALEMSDPAAVRAMIQKDFEARILGFMRGPVGGA